MKVERGSVHGIVGENGAGKSTLMSILYGFYEADSGEIFIDGSKATILTSRNAIAAGIGMVHQHFMLVDNFTVLENVMLGAEGGAVLKHGLQRVRVELERLSSDYGLSVDPDAKIEALPVGEQQRVEILKALYRGARILILDEPSAVLTPQETDQLFRILQALKAQGVTVIIITHKLKEIMAVTDNVTVIRQGAVVAHRKTAETNDSELAELMVGRKISLVVDRGAHRPGAETLVVEHLSIRDMFGIERVKDVSFTVRAGEIVGIAGVSGNGQSELMEALAGIRRLDGGRFFVGGREVTPEKPCPPSEMRGLKVASVPEDRHRQGQVGRFSAQETAILGYQEDPALNGPILMKLGAIREHCVKLMEKFDVRPRDPDLRSANFSGGNQQKMILAREMDREPIVLLVGQPTRGVDIGAIEFIHQQLIAMRDAGCAVLLVSVELDEIMNLSDRILVMCGGELVGEVAAEKADRRMLGLMMANVKPADAAPNMAEAADSAGVQ